MGQVYPPVKQWNIVLTYVRDEQEYTILFKAVGELRQFLYKYKKIGELVGYVIDKNRGSENMDHEFTSAELSFEYTDQVINGGNSFDNAKKMAEFFDAHPEFAKCVGYFKKKKY